MLGYVIAIINLATCVLLWLYMATEEHITQEQYDCIKDKLDDCEEALQDAVDQYISLVSEYNVIEKENQSLCNVLDCLRGDE